MNSSQVQKCEALMSSIYSFRSYRSLITITPLLNHYPKCNSFVCNFVYILIHPCWGVTFIHTIFDSIFLKPHKSDKIQNEIIQNEGICSIYVLHNCLVYLIILQ